MRKAKDYRLYTEYVWDRDQQVIAKVLVKDYSNFGTIQLDAGGSKSEPIPFSSDRFQILSSSGEYDSKGDMIIEGHYVELTKDSKFKKVIDLTNIYEVRMLSGELYFMSTTGKELKAVVEIEEKNVRIIGNIFQNSY